VQQIPLLNVKQLSNPEIMRHYLLLSFLFVCTNSMFGQKIPEEVKENIKKRVDYGDNVSIAVAFIYKDKVDSFYYGTTAKENGTTIDGNSVFEIGSISKVFTTILLANEVEKGTMKLSDPIAKYLPKRVKVPVRNGKEIRLQDLATHTSALPRMPSNFSPADPMNPFVDYSLEQLYAFLNSYELPRDIGASYEYSNYATGLLGHILELHTGKTYEELIMEVIANPLKMNNTRIAMNSEMKSKLAKGHQGINEVPNWDFMTMASAGAIKSNLNDMVKFIKANMMESKTLLWKAMRLSHQTAFAGENNFSMGLGWHHEKTSQVERIVWHNGRTGGYTVFTGFVEGKEVAVVVLSNSTESVDDIGLKLLDNSRNIRVPVKPISIDDTILESYVGKYELAPTFHIEITKKESQLFLQATNQPRFQVYPSSENEFFLKVVKASITFNKDEAGKVKSLTLHQNGRDIEGKRL